MHIHQEAEEKRHVSQKGNNIKEFWTTHSASQTQEQSEGKVDK